MLEETAIYLLVGLLAGGILGYIMSMRVKTRLSKDLRDSYQAIIDNKTKVISTMRGKLANIQTFNLNGVEPDNLQQIADSFINQLPAPFRTIARPAAEALLEKYKENPEQMKLMAGDLLSKIKQGKVPLAQQEEEGI